MPIPIHERIEADYSTGKVTAAAYGRMVTLGEQAKALAHTFAELAPACRELSLALTELQQAHAWAQKAILMDQSGKGEPMPDEPVHAELGAPHRTAAQWRASNPVLPLGQWGVETDTGQRKRGDGTKGWVALDYSTMTTDGDDLLTAAQVAERRGVTVRTVARWAESGKVPVAQKLPGPRGSLLFRADAVDSVPIGDASFNDYSGERCDHCGANHSTSGHVDLLRP